MPRLEIGQPVYQADALTNMVASEDGSNNSPTYQAGFECLFPVPPLPFSPPEGRLYELGETVVRGAPYASALLDAALGTHCYKCFGSLPADPALAVECKCGLARYCR